MSLYKYPDSQFYWARFTINGREHRLSTGETDRRAAEAAEKRLRAEKTLERPPQARSGVRTLAALGVEDIAGAVRRNTTKQHQEVLTRRWAQIIEIMGDLDPQDITSERLRIYAETRRGGHGLKAQTVRRELADIRRALELAVAEKSITGLPVFPKLRSDAPNTQRAGKYIEADVMKAVLREVSDGVRDACVFCADTGLRSEELCRVRASFIRPAPTGSKAAAIIALEALATKNRKQRIVGLSKRALSIAQRREQEVGDLLFPQRGIALALRRACKRLHLPFNVTLRDLRHTFASNALRKSGGNLAAVSEALGHSEVETTALYLHAREQDVIDLAATTDAETRQSKSAERRKSAESKARKSLISEDNLERETRFELATLSLGSCMNPRLSYAFAHFPEANSAIQSQPMHAVLGRVSRQSSPILAEEPGTVVATEYKRISVTCQRCQRVADVEMGPDNRTCIFCGGRTK